METNSKYYQIHIGGKVPERWQVWFEPLSMYYTADGDTLLQGQIVDQSQLIGVINQIHNLNLKLMSVNCEDDRDNSPPAGC